MKRYVNKQWLENHIARLSYLLGFAQETRERQRLEAARHFYLCKLVEMDEHNLNYISV